MLPRTFLLIISAFTLALVLVVAAVLAVRLALTSAISPSPNATPAQNSVVTDASRLFRVTLPPGWNITLNEGKKGVQLSRLRAESQDFILRTDPSAGEPFIPHYYEQGATITIRAYRGSASAMAERAGTASRPIIIDTFPGTFRDQNEPSTMLGQDVDATVNREGITYYFQFTYNPDTYPSGQDVFQTILDSLRFL